MELQEEEEEEEEEVEGGGTIADGSTDFPQRLLSRNLISVLFL